ncbi:hypothetical protein SDC9_111756 [bioreactor metagenome]|uniref:Protein TolB n=1 Tax=bioreactor metagenome TaxID=1076179 RepID=A0A645BHL5_9ZZZZ|nr:hypothetical protein [Oscillospiraceae bacterium]
MGEKIIPLTFISDGRLGVYKNGKSEFLTLKKQETYINVIRQINKGNDWKSTGRGAAFMGVMYKPADEDEGFSLNAAEAVSDELLVYACTCSSTGCIYTKKIDSCSPEGLVAASTDWRVSSICACRSQIEAYGGSLLCVAEMEYKRGESHIVLFYSDKPYVTVTDGDTRDANPFISPDGSVCYFDYCGNARDINGIVIDIGPRVICSYDFKTHLVNELLSDDSIDYFSPKSDDKGNLYYIKRPYKEKRNEDNGFVNILKAPFKIIKAVGGAFDLFTCKYAGESLKSNEEQKAKNKSEKQIFIENNIINADREQKENAATGEKFPGIIPNSWVLACREPSGNEKVIKKGVCGFTLYDYEIVYTNGSNLVMLRNNHESDTEHEETLLLKGNKIIL